MLAPATEAGAMPSTAASAAPATKANAAPSAIEPAVPLWVAVALAAVAAVANAEPSAIEPAPPPWDAPPPASLADGAAAEEIRCPPGWAAADQAWDATSWLSLGDGRTSVRLLRFETERNRGCSALPPFSATARSATPQVVWEKTWPDDFRADAIRLGWPDGMVDRCKPPRADWPSYSEFLLSEQCNALRAELFYGTPEAMAEAQLHSGLSIRPAMYSRWSALQLAACKKALVTALPLGGTPQACRTRIPSLVLDWPPAIRGGR